MNLILYLDKQMCYHIMYLHMELCHFTNLKSHVTGCIGQEKVNTTILVLLHQVSTMTWGFI